MYTKNSTIKEKALFILADIMGEENVSIKSICGVILVSCLILLMSIAIFLFISANGNFVGGIVLSYLSMMLMFAVFIIILKDNKEIEFIRRDRRNEAKRRLESLQKVRGHSKL